MWRQLPVLEPVYDKTMSIEKAQFDVHKLSGPETVIREHRKIGPKNREAVFEDI